MALVDYTSDSDGDSDRDENISPPVEPPAKKPSPRSDTTAPSATIVNSISTSNSNDSAAKDGNGTSNGPPAKKKPKLDNDLPPLPAAFHDLYASTVRTSTSDDPSLHQGRTRQTPHKVGNWPSHVYIEWHPPRETFSLLDKLISTLQKKITEHDKDKDITITSFLTSDLGVPLPLHISLSRPLSLTTANKDEFLNDLLSTIRASNIRPFDLSIRDAEWHRTEESGRSFLVLRLQSSSTKADSGNKNPELTELLRRCNELAREYNQPGLYEWASSSSSDKLPPLRPSESHSQKQSTTDCNNNNAAKKSVDNAFHISIAWSFTPPDDDLMKATKQVFSAAFAATPSCTNWIRGKEDNEDEEKEHQPTEAKALCHVQVEAVKAKIGNVVTNIPLLRPGDRVKDGKDSSRKLPGLTYG